MDETSELQASRSLGRAVGAGAAYAAVVFAFAFVTGAVRTIIISLNIGVTPLMAVIIEMPVILYFAWRVCGTVMKWSRVSPDLGVRLLACVAALIVMLGAEYSLSALVIGRTLPDFLATYAAPEAMIGLAGQFVFATFPLFRWRPF